eukprot:2293162-Rhodomonas_salina.1
MCYSTEIGYAATLCVTVLRQAMLLRIRFASCYDVCCYARCCGPEIGYAATSYSLCCYASCYGTEIGYAATHSVWLGVISTTEEVTSAMLLGL